MKCSDETPMRFFGALIAAAGGAAQLNRFHAAMKKIKDASPSILTVGGGLMYTAVPQKIMAENPQVDFAIVGVFGDNEEALCGTPPRISKAIAKLWQHPGPHLAQRRRSRAEAGIGR